MKYVLTIKEEICTANGKDVKATELLKVMAHYGIVETYDNAIANEITPLKSTIDNLVKQNEAIKEQALDEFDMAILRVARDAKKKVVDEKDIQITDLTKELQNVIALQQQKNQELSSFLDKYIKG